MWPWNLSADIIEINEFSPMLSLFSRCTVLLETRSKAPQTEPRLVFNYLQDKKNHTRTKWRRCCYLPTTGFCWGNTLMRERIICDNYSRCIKSCLSAWPGVWWHFLLVVTHLLHRWEEIHWQEREHGWASLIGFPILNEVKGVYLGPRVSLADPSSLVHLNPKSSITGWSFNLLPRELLPSGFGLWTVSRPRRAATQWWTSLILCFWNSIRLLRVGQLLLG